MLNFIGFLFSLLKGIYNTCAIHTQVNRQASVARILFAGFFGIFSSSINKILLDAQIKEYNTKIATRQNTYDEEHNNMEVTLTAPQLPPLPHNPNHLHSIIFKPTPQFFQNTLFNQSHQMIHPHSVPTPSYASQVTPTYSPYHSNRSSNNSPDSPQISQELDNFITLQQQLIHPNTLTIHQISSTIESSNPPTPTPSSAYTASLAQSPTSTETSSSTHRAYRTFKRKFPNHPFPTKPGTACEYINHPQHTNTKDYLAITSPSFPQYT